YFDFARAALVMGDEAAAAHRSGVGNFEIERIDMVPDAFRIDDHATLGDFALERPAEGLDGGRSRFDGDHQFGAAEQRRSREDADVRAAIEDDVAGFDTMDGIAVDPNLLFGQQEAHQGLMP